MIKGNGWNVTNIDFLVKIERSDKFLSVLCFTVLELQKSRSVCAVQSPIGFGSKSSILEWP